MLETLLVFTLGITPPLLSIWLMRKAEARAQARLRRAANSPALRLSYSYRQTEAIEYLIGDKTCRFNAHSIYIRCAVNPEGPCEQCPHYEPEDIKNNI